MPVPQTSLQRLPQTRIYIREFITASVRVRSIEYFNDTLFLIMPLADTKQQALFLEMAFGIDLISLHPAEQVSPGKYAIPCAEAELLWLFPKGEERNLRGIQKFLDHIPEREYRLHPLHQMRLSNCADMERIDRLWAALSCIGPGRDITPSIFKTESDHFIWLQEIYLHLGWFAELERFYKKNNAKKNRNCAYEDAAERFRMVRDGAQEKTDIARTDGDFVRQYLKHSTRDSDLQDFWQYLHYPAFRFWLKKDMAARPDQYIALAALAAARGFFWYFKLKDLLEAFLPEKMAGPAGLFLLLKECTPLYWGRDRLEFNPFMRTDNLQEIQSDGTASVLSLVRQNKTIYTKLRRKEILFSIDKRVRLGYTLSKQSLSVQPVLFRPPLKALETVTVQIKIDSVFVQIPLIWSRFEVTINRMRLKFLRKKDRFQVHMRGKKYTEAFHINNQKVQAFSGHYPVFYIPVVKSAAQTEAALFNGWGGVPIPNKAAFIHGWTLDAFQQLREDARLSVEAKKTSGFVTLNHNRPENEIAVKSGTEFRLKNRYSPAYTLQAKAGESYLNSFLYTPAELLQNRVRVYTAANPQKTARLFYDALGFYPYVGPLSEAHPGETAFIIIVSAAFKGTRVTEAEAYKTITLSASHGQRAILAHPASIKMILSAHLYRNKFDFNREL